MHDFVIIGTVIGLFFGLLHMSYLTKVVASGSDTAVTTNRISALNFAGWTLILWLLMGAYILGFWLIGFVFYLVFKAFR